MGKVPDHIANMRLLADCRTPAALLEALILAEEHKICALCTIEPLEPGQQCDECLDIGNAEAC